MYSIPIGGGSMFQALLVPLDGSPSGEQAVPFAHMLAQQHNATVHLVHVHTPNDSVYIEGMPVIDEALHSLGKQHEQTYLERVAQRMFAEPPLPVTTAVLDHPVAPALLGYAGKHN